MASIVSLYSLEGKIAVVTGAASGIGCAVALRLCEAGASVVAVDRDAKGLAELSARAARAHWQIRILVQDISDPKAIDSIHSFALAEVSIPTIWVNSAGVMHPTGPLETASDERLTELFSVNVWPAFRAARIAAKHLPTGSVIINMASINGLRGAEGIAGYVMTKHAIVGLTRALARELGAKGIRCVAIAPGYVATEGAKTAIGALRAGKQRTQSEPTTPLGRTCSPDDIALATLFVASDMAAMITGQVIVVDGGVTA